MQFGWCAIIFLGGRKSMEKISHIRKENGESILYVDGKPFIALSGELHNSSSSSLDYMDRVVWPALRPLGLNTVVAPVYWECVEPEPGVFDYSLVDGLILQARREGVKLVFLWFGLWKNGMSTYIPGWVITTARNSSAY
jgi:beta-galactosidase GanA